MKRCDPKEAALKSFFLGPQAENAPWVRKLLGLLFDQWVNWRRSLYPRDGRAISEADQASPEFQNCIHRFETELREILGRFEAEVPKFSPRYVGHMFSEISLPALFGHIVSLIHNPNNLSTDVSRVGTQIENEAIAFLAAMIGFDPSSCRGHFTSGGTISNFEALIRARSRMDRWMSLAAYSASQQNSHFDLFHSAHLGWEAYESLLRELKNLRPEELRHWSFLSNNPFDFVRRIEKTFGARFRGPVVLVPDNKHYSWQKGVSLLGLSEEAFWPVKLDRYGKLCIQDLENKIKEAQKEQRPVLMVVSIAGTTELGEVDRVDEVQDLLDHWAEKEKIFIWHHIDAAYGGFLCSLDVKTEEQLIGKSASLALQAIRRGNSVTLDPHKLGYVPYSSGAFLCRDTREYELSFCGAPYLFDPASKNIGTQTLEGSRSAAGAVASWLTAKSIGFDSEGYGRILARTIRARAEVEALVRSKGEPLWVAPSMETNILCLCVARRNDSLSRVNKHTLDVWLKISASPEAQVFVSKTRLNSQSYGEYIRHFAHEWNGSIDTDSLVLLRICLMNPFFTTHETQVHYPEILLNSLFEAAKGS